jgi:hypothetical protein
MAELSSTGRAVLGPLLYQPPSEPLAASELAEQAA